MSQQQSYSYNPDLPTRKWHKKWINPVISLQNAPPTSHGTPAPTKEEGEFGHAGFKVQTWIPLDEDDDVSEETLNAEEDWWSKPGAPLRPELKAAKEKEKEAETGTANAPVVVEDKMQIDGPETNGAVPSASTETVPAVAVVSPAVMSPKAPTPAPAQDTEMPDAPLSVHLSTVTSPPKEQPATTAIETTKSPSHLSAQHSPEMARSPAAQTPVEPVTTSTTQPSPPKEPATIADMFPSKASPPPDPLGQAREVAAGFAIESSTEHDQIAQDAGNISGAGGGIAGEGCRSQGT